MQSDQVDSKKPLAHSNDEPTRVFIKTHGCQMNEYDSARMLDLLKESQNAIAVDDPAQADLLLLNTCSIREKAQEKVFHQLGRWRSLKEVNPALKIAVGGCVASQEGKNIGKFIIDILTQGRASPYDFMTDVLNIDPGFYIQ